MLYIAFFWLFIFLLSLYVLVKASDYFTKSAEKIGLFLGIPAFIVGVTIVAVGTSLPELISSLFSVFKGATEIVAGNVLGSNITNIFLILGLAAILSKKKLVIIHELIHVDLPFLVGSALFMALMIVDGRFTLFEALLSIAGMIFYFLYSISLGKKHREKNLKKEVEREIDKKIWNPIITLLISGVFIFIAANYTVESVIRLSKLFNIGVEIISVTAVALGTSLPELMVTITAAKSGKAEMAVGNILGSNIFNTFAVMGIPALFGTLIISQSLLYFALPVMLVATLLYFFITQDKEITKWEGWMLILFYIFFIGKMLL